MGAKRRRTTSQASSPGGGANAVEAGVSLKVLGGGQPLVDDFDDEDYEARKVRHAIHMVGGAHNWSTRVVAWNTAGFRDLIMGSRDIITR